MPEGQWYYCLDHRTVEAYDACRSGSRLGPYPTPAEAAHAIEHAAGRNSAWENDPRFNDPEEKAEEDDSEGWGPFRH